MDLDTIRQKLLRKVVLKEPHPNDSLLSCKRGMDKLPDQTVLRKDLINQFNTDVMRDVVNL